MSNKQKLTLDEHRRLGAELATIWWWLKDKLSRRRDKSMQRATDRLNELEKGSPTHRRLLRVEKDIDRLRRKLDSLLAEQHPGVDGRSIYYGNRPAMEGRTLDALHVRLSYEVGTLVLTDRVPAPLIDLYLRCERSMFALKTSTADHPEDARRA